MKRQLDLHGNVVASFCPTTEERAHRFATGRTPGGQLPYGYDRARSAQARESAVRADGGRGDRGAPDRDEPGAVHSGDVVFVARLEAPVTTEQQSPATRTGLDGVRPFTEGCGAVSFKRLLGGASGTVARFTLHLLHSRRSLRTTEYRSSPIALRPRLANAKPHTSPKSIQPQGPRSTPSVNGVYVPAMRR